MPRSSGPRVAAWIVLDARPPAASPWGNAAESAGPATLMIRAFDARHVPGVGDFPDDPGEPIPDGAQEAVGRDLGPVGLVRVVEDQAHVADAEECGPEPRRATSPRPEGRPDDREAEQAARRRRRPPRPCTPAPARARPGRPPRPATRPAAAMTAGRRHHRRGRMSAGLASSAGRSAATPAPKRPRDSNPPSGRRRGARRGSGPPDHRRRPGSSRSRARQTRRPSRPAGAAWARAR